MSGRTLTHAILVLAAHAPGAEAIWGLWGGYGFPDGVMDIAANTPQWAALIADSNASAEITFTGRDVSQSWPGKPMDGWKLNMTVVDTTSGPLPANGGFDVVRVPFLVSKDIRVVAPQSLLTPSKNTSDHGAPVVNVNDDWVFCAWRWFNPPYDNVTAYRNPDNLDAAEDGSCEKFVSKECIDAVEKAARTSYSMNYEPKGLYGSRHTCDEVEIPEECGPKSSKGTPLSEDLNTLPDWGVPIRYLNGSTTWQGGYSVDEDNRNETQLMWRLMTQDIQPVLTLFGKYHNDSDKSEVEPGFTKLLCIRAPEAGSRGAGGKSDDQEGDGAGDEGAAVALSGRHSVMLAGVVVLLAWIL